MTPSPYYAGYCPGHTAGGGPYGENGLLISSHAWFSLAEGLDKPLSPYP